MKALLIAALFASQAAFADSIAELCPVAENVRGHADSVDGIAENDLYSLANPLDRAAYWVDTHHYTDAGYELLASQVAEMVLSQCVK